MAIALKDKQNVLPPSALYPNGQIKDDDGSGNGTPVNVDVYGDFHQFFARLISKAGITPNGIHDSAYDGFQYFQSLQNMLGDRVIGSGTDDLNKYTEPGIYAVVITTPLNAPFPIGNAVGADQAIMIVCGLSNTARSQTIYTRNGWAFRAFTRSTLVFGSWQGEYTKEISSKTSGFVWNMDTTTSITVAHGLDATKIIKAEAFIRPDGVTFSPYISRPLSMYVSQNIQGGLYWDATNIILERLTSGIFDSASYIQTTDGIDPYSRGLIRITVLI